MLGIALDLNNQRLDILPIDPRETPLTIRSIYPQQLENYLHLLYSSFVAFASSRLNNSVIP
ncbi:MAG: hypothetical protein WBA89_03760 [Microcoleus sp.]|uniref:hypothetical protein n=1 Tax=Microcoleus sp. TaxID=44472 RepID=UPI003C77AD9E